MQDVDCEIQLLTSLIKECQKADSQARINLQKGPIKLSGWNYSDLGYTFWLYYYLCYCQFYSVLSAIPPK